jgi:hypothetical protein
MGCYVEFIDESASIKCHSAVEMVPNGKDGMQFPVTGKQHRYMQKMQNIRSFSDRCTSIHNNLVGKYVFLEVL